MNFLLKNLIIVPSLFSVSLVSAESIEDCRDNFVYRRDLGLVGSTQEAFNGFMRECVVGVPNHEEVSTGASDSKRLEATIDSGHDEALPSEVKDENIQTTRQVYRDNDEGPEGLWDSIFLTTTVLSSAYLCSNFLIKRDRYLDRSRR